MEFFLTFSEFFLNFLVSSYGLTAILIILAIILTIVGRDLLLCLEELEKMNNFLKKKKDKTNKR